MTITPIGFVIIPLSVAIFFVRPGLLVSWAIVVSVFQAASVINVGGDSLIGISPFFFVLILIAARFIPLYVTGKCGFARGEPILNVLRPLTLLTLWGIVSSFVLPFVFANLAVNTPHGGMDTAALPLHWSVSNAAQAAYLSLECVFILYATSLARGHSAMEKSMRAFRIAGLIAVLIGVYQLIAHKAGLFYPKELFNSNEAWAQLVTQKIAGIWRLSATFTEPSAAGSFFAAWSCFLLFVVADRTTARWSDWLLLCAGIAMLLLTTSSTGYVVLGIMLSMFVLQHMLGLITRGSMSPRVGIICLVIGLGTLGAIAVLPDFGRLLREVLLQKTESISGKNRAATQWESLIVTNESWGLGVGLGSNRPSGMLFYVLSNLGVPGLLLFAYCLYVTLFMARMLLQPLRRCGFVRGYVRGSAGAFIVTLLALSISGAELTTPQLWITWSLVMGVMQHACATPQQAAETFDVRPCIIGPILLVDAVGSG